MRTSTGRRGGGPRRGVAALVAGLVAGLALLHPIATVPLTAQQAGRMPGRAVLPPYGTREAALAGRPDTTWARSLDGAWRIHWVPSSLQAPGGFEDPDYDDSSWDTIPVPSNQEMHGFGVVRYADSGIPPGPPHPIPPGENPTASYRRWFDVPRAWSGRRVLLHFGSVGAEARVWVNGREAGRTVGSKLPAEFDVTRLIRPGRNLLAVRVWRWSRESFLEDVDFLRMSGIDRPVRLLSYPAAHVWDVRTRADYDAGSGVGVLRAEVDLAGSPGPAGWPPLRAELVDSTGRTVLERTLTPRPADRGGSAAGADQRGTAVADAAGARAVLLDTLAGVAPWTAETPALYTLLLSLSEGPGAAPVYRRRVGFRRVEVSDGLLRVNGVPVELRGVNRHEHDPRTGRVMTRARMLQDLTLMRRMNINAVRTSHYPNDPLWYELADSVGLYVVDEAFVESNGTSFHPDTTPANRPEWREAHLDRILRMVARDAGHPSVIAWSLGNESGDGAAFREAYARVRERDPSRPVVFEMADLRDHTDVFFPMYARIHTLENYAAERRRRPLILSEYAHAMGNSLGNLADYWVAIRAHDQLQGGFIWDWVDQALPVERGGRRWWGYGDDFGGRDGGGNFAINGLVDADRRPHPHAREAAHVYRPVTARAVDAVRGVVEVTNHYDFLGLDHLNLAWTLTEDGVPVAEGLVDSLRVPPHGTDVVTLPLPAHEPVPGAELFLDLSFRTRAEAPLVPAGHEVAHEQFPIPLRRAPVRVPLERTAKINRRVEDGVLRLSGEAAPFDIGFDLTSGTLSYFRWQGRDLVTGGPRPNFWRPPTDNDYGWDMPRRLAAWKEASGAPQDVSVDHWQNSDRDVVVVVARRLRGVAARHLTRFHVFGSGEVSVEARLEPDAPGAPDLPKLGLTLALPRSLSHVTWFGRGPHENYVDRRSGAPVGRYDADVTELGHPYVRPQETGNRTDTRWVALRDGAGYGLLAVGDPLLEFSALPWDDADLDGGPVKSLRHAWDVVERDHVTLDLDQRQMGLGGDTSWGARPHPEYRIPAAPYRMRLWLAPLAPDGPDAAEVARRRRP